MPVPEAGMISGLAMSSFESRANPQTGQKLGSAFGQVLAAACQGFVARVLMEPGVPCAVVPPTMVGTVAGVGRLVGTGLTEVELKLEAERAAKGTGMSAADQKDFVETLVKMAMKGFQRFQEFAQILPGTPVAGGVTTAPARLAIAVGAISGELQAMAISMNPPRPSGSEGGWLAARPQESRQAGGPVMGGHRGATPPLPGPPAVALPSDFPQITATLLGKTFQEMATLVMVAPGIPVAGQVTAAPGRLM